MAAWQPTDLLPGLYLVLLGFLLDRALRRWLDPVPAKIWGAFALALAILLGPALFGGKVLLPLELLTRFTPYESVEPPPGRSNRLQLDLVSQISPALALVRDLGPEVVRVGDDSVMAVVGARDGDGDHLPLRPAQRTVRREHQGFVELDPGLQHLRPQALDAQDVEHLAGAAHGVVVDLLQEPLGLRGRNRVNPGHTPES